MIRCENCQYTRCLCLDHRNPNVDNVKQEEHKKEYLVHSCAFNQKGRKLYPIEKVEGDYKWFYNYKETEAFKYKRFVFQREDGITVGLDTNGVLGFEIASEDLTIEELKAIIETYEVIKKWTIEPSV